MLPVPVARPMTAMQYVIMYFRFVDDVMLFRNGANWQEQRQRIYFVEFARQRHRGHFRLHLVISYFIVY